jgi:ATP-dependent exoDNAse (exonuclease V) beta subunit
VGPFQSESDEDERAREREETKRLLYVSLTRARDRLYLGGSTRGGELKAAQGGLAEVLPASLRALWSAPGDAATWQARGGAHSIRLCRPAETPRGTTVPGRETPLADPSAKIPVSPLDDRAFVRLRPGPDRPRHTVTERAAAEAAGDLGGAAGDPDALAATLVHRLFQASLEPGTPANLLTDRARRLLRPEDTAGRDDIAEVVDRSVRTYAALRGREDVSSIFDGECLCELTFSLAVDGHASGQPGILRGTIDCLVLRQDGSATVVEVRIGPLRPQHEHQLAWHVRAARALFPDYRVDGRLIGANEPCG